MVMPLADISRGKKNSETKTKVKQKPPSKMFQTYGGKKEINIGGDVL